MNASQSARLNKFRVSRTFKLAPTARAIRAVLAVSATMLALSGSGIALAGTCVSDAADTMSCNGDFTETVPGSIFVPTVDLTLILGDSTPTSVIPADGDIGIDASWGGMVGITSYADILTDGADGIHQYGSTSATLSNYGSIATSVTGVGENAVDISAYGDVTVVNGGGILASGSGLYDVSAVTAYSLHGGVSITNQASGTITATAGDGNAVAVEAYTFGGYVLVSNDGGIAASSFNGDASGVRAQATGEVDAYGNLTAGNVRITDVGSIEATSDNGQAIGIYASALFGRTSVVVGGTGSVIASGDELAIGIGASADVALVFNQGSVTAGAGDLAIGIVSSSTRYSYVSQSGSITVDAAYGDAVGISANVPAGFSKVRNAATGTIVATGADAATGLESSADSSYIYNDGALTVTADTGVATGIVAHDVYYSGINMFGTLDVIALEGSAIGIDTSGATSYTVSLSIDGATSVTGADAATGLLASAGYYAAVALSGSLTVNAGTGDGIGIFAEVVGGAGLYASGISIAGSDSPFGMGTIVVNSDYGNATGIWATSDGSDSVVENAGSVSATADYGLATGIRIDTQGFTDASVINSGSMDVAGYQAVGIALDAYAGVAYVGNSGDVSVASSAVLARASGIDAVSQLAALVNNSGSIAVTVGLAEAVGVRAIGVNDRVTVINSGDISVHSNIDQVPYGEGAYYAGRDYANGIVVSAEHNATVVNSGNITADATVHAQGLKAYAEDGLVTVANNATGAITVSGQQQAWGIEAFSFVGGVTVENAGSLVASIASSSDGFGYAFGVYAGTTYGGLASVVNSGSISLTSVTDGNSYLFGIKANAHFMYAEGDALTSVINSGDILISGASDSIGIRATMYQTTGHGDTVGNLLVVSSGDITVEGTTQQYGIRASSNSQYGSTVLANSGNVTVTGGAKSFGMELDFNDGGTATLSNSGEVTSSSAYDALGIYARYVGSAANGTVEHGDLSFDNSGTISASTSPNGSASSSPSPFNVRVAGVQLRISDIDVTAHNSGSITAISTSNPTGVGEFATSRVIGFGVVNYGGEGIIDVSNTGSITASLTSDGRKHGTHFTNSAGILVTSSYGAATVANSGLVSAFAQIDATTVAGTVPRPVTVEGIRLENKAARAYNSMGDMTVINDATGVVTATGISNYGDASIRASGIYAGQGIPTSNLVSADHGILIENAGAVSASATVGGIDILGIATANGIFALGATGSYANGFMEVSNSGTVNASATAIAAANATGISALTGGADASNVVTVSSSGIVNAAATSTTTATAIGVLAAADEVAVALEAGGNIHATATGADGNAIGLSVSGDLITASNAGAISAEFVGAGDTYGALIASPTGEVTFTNSGSITATNADHAVGVQLDSLTATTLINSGTITSVSVAGDNLAVRTGASTDAIQNTGTLNGGLFTGDGDDTFDNAVGGIWNTAGSSDFGAGDDTIINAGMINLDNATITLGGFAASGNVFTNTGTISVAGDTNTIDMGAGNPLAFTNTGTISFQDGVPDDRLTIVGDFAGQGSLDMDVSQLNNAGDLLYINGNVVDGSVTTINTHVLDLLPTAATGTIAVVNVSGDSTADSFVLGDVTFDSSRSFLTVQAIGLQSEIDASNATADVFSVDFAVNGLSETGALAAAFVPAVQRLMNSQVGTWRQRMGVIDKMSHGPSVWARAFSDNGTVNPSHQESNFGQDGDLAFDQRSSGEEVGVDYAFNEVFSVGLLVGKAQASQSLNGTGLGSSKLDGNTSGVYATWISPAGFYVDASYRRMSFDAKLNSAAGQSRTDGKADAFNVEAGYAWTLGEGLKLEPQLQYTHTTIDEVDTLEGAMAGFTPEEGTSSRARVGLAVRKSFGKGDTEWTPYATLSAVREFDGDNAYSIDGAFFGGTSTEGTSALVEGGLNVRTGNLSFSGGVNWQDGGALESVVGGQLGVRYSW